jgi:hypothetical protein
MSSRSGNVIISVFSAAALALELLTVLFSAFTPAGVISTLVFTAVAVEMLMIIFSYLSEALKLHTYSFSVFASPGVIFTSVFSAVLV